LGHACVVVYVIAYVHIGFSTTLNVVDAAEQVRRRLPERIAPFGQGPAPPVTGIVKVFPTSAGHAIEPM
jgi:hypothetical protein